LLGVPAQHSLLNLDRQKGDKHERQEDCCRKNDNAHRPTFHHMGLDTDTVGFGHQEE
jgi:hypothetical protein